MKSRDFCYWLQGFIELHPSPDKEWSKNWHPDAHQWEIIKRHLALVFKHEIDPEAGDAAAQEALNQIHSGKPNKEKPQLGGIDPVTGFVMRC